MVNTENENNCLRNNHNYIYINIYIYKLSTNISRSDPIFTKIGGSFERKSWRA